MTKLAPYLALFVLFLLFVVGIAGQFFTHIDHSIRIFFSNTDPAYVLNQEVREFFPEDEFYIFMFEGKDLLNDDFITKLDHVTNKVQSLDHVERVLTLTTVDQIQGTQDGFKTAPLFDTNQDFDLTPEERKNKILKDRFAPGSIISKNAEAVAFILRPEKDTASQTHFDLRAKTLEILEEENLSNKLTAIAGANEMTYVQFESMMTSLKKFIPLTMIINLLFITWFFPRVLPIALSFISLSIATLLPLWVLNVMQAKFTMIHTMMAPLMAGLCTALLIHYLSKIKYYSNLGYAPAARAQKARSDIFKSALYTALTTTAGLGALSLSSIPPIRSFGLSTAAGMMIIFVMITYIWPPILAAWDSKKPWPQGYNIDRFLNAVLRQCAHFAVRRAGWVLTASIVIIAAGIPAIQNIKVETDVFSFFNQTHRINQETKRVETLLSGTTNLDILVRTNTQEGLKNPELLHEIRELQNWLETLPEVDRTVSMAEMIEEMHWAFHQENSNFRTIPDDENLISQYLFIFDGEDLYEFVNYDFDVARIGVSLNIHRAGEIQKTIEKINDYARSHQREELEIKVSGFGSLYARLSDLIVKTQLWSLLSALVVIFLFFCIVFRSLRSALLCMIPNAAPIFVIFTLMGFAGIWLDVGTAMIASVAVGIAVDDTIHLYHAYIKRRRAGRGALISLMRAYQHAGRAVIATTIVLAAQFLVIATSDFVPTQNFGLLSALGVMTALIFDLLVLPACIVICMKYKAPSGSKKKKT